MKIDDILTDIGDGVMYTLHAHTQFCDARAPMEDFIKKAVSMGFTHYGFTPHAPITVPSTCNMSRQDVAQYFAEVDRLRAEYPQIRILRGMEVDYIDQDCGPAHPYFQELGLDYTIGSVHFVPNRDGEYYDIDGRPAHFQQVLSQHFDNDLYYVVDKYFEQSMTMIAAGGFDIIGHFDKIKHNAASCKPGIEDTEWYKERVDALIDSIIKSEVIVEVNTKAWDEYQQLFPAQRHWRRLIDAGVRIIVNSDAHYPERINAARPGVLKALRYLGYKPH